MVVYLSDTIRFADDVALKVQSEADLQRSVYNLHKLSSRYNMQISAEKTKVMAYCSKYPVPSKICINDKFIERVNELNFLEYNLSFHQELDIYFKICSTQKLLQSSAIRSIIS